MQKTNNLTSVLDDILPVIDRGLAKLDVPLTQRPIEAAETFVLCCVEEVREQKGAVAAKPGPPEEFWKAAWFADLYALVEKWYHKRYPGSMWQQRDEKFFGIVMIAGTVFAIHIPIVRTQPGRPGETVWLSFPDGLRDNEQALDWIEDPPNHTTLLPQERCDAEEFATEVANALRFIGNGLIAVSGGDDKLAGFKAGVMRSLESAAKRLLEPDPKSVQAAYWELQLACESALKALMVQRTGEFKTSHDLFFLYDFHKEIPAPLPEFNRDLLKRLPRWKETADLRYGQGTREDRADCVECYRATLTIVAGTVRSMEKWGIGSAQFEIARAPWIAQSSGTGSATETN